MPQKMHFAYRNLMFHHRLRKLDFLKKFSQVKILTGEMPPFKRGLGVGLMGCWGFWVNGGFGLVG